MRKIPTGTIYVTLSTNTRTRKR